MSNTVNLNIPITTSERAKRHEVALEVERRMDAVIDAAVEWHQCNDDTWLDKGETLGKAIDALLELRQVDVVCQYADEQRQSARIPCHACGQLIDDEIVILLCDDGERRQFHRHCAERIQYINHISKL